MKKTRGKAGKSAKPSPKPDPNQYPQGWDRKRIEAVIAHYENQTDDEAIAEDEAAYSSSAFTMMQVPRALVSKVERLIARAG